MLPLLWLNAGRSLRLAFLCPHSALISTQEGYPPFFRPVGISLVFKSPRAINAIIIFSILAFPSRFKIELLYFSAKFARGFYIKAISNISSIFNADPKSTQKFIEHGYGNDLLLNL
jgi:hypothetical protein